MLKAHTKRKQDTNVGPSEGVKETQYPPPVLIKKKNLTPVRLFFSKKRRKKTCGARLI